MLLSVIIPIYNVDKYIRECFDSILSQEFADIEFICIDDGSTDTSGHICDEYAARDTRFIVKHTTNQGASAARNLGLSLAQGDYIAWIDPDDYVTTDWLSNITQTIREYNCDILVFDYIRVKNNQTIIKQYREKSGYVDQLQFLSDITDDQIIQSQLWQKVFKRELFHDIRFPLNITCMEDYAILHFLVEKANNVFYLRKPLYYYRQRNDSLVMKPDLDKSYQCCLIAQARYEYLSAKYQNIHLIGYWGQVMGFCIQFHKSDKAEKQQFKNIYVDFKNMIHKNMIHILSSKQLLLKNKLKLILIGSGLIGIAVHLQQKRKG